MESESATLADLDAQLLQLLRDCQRDGMTQQEMRVIFAPLLAHFSAVAAENATGKRASTVAGRILPFGFIFLALAGVLLAVGGVGWMPRLVVGPASSGNDADRGLPAAPTAAGLLQSIKSDLTTKLLVLVRLLLIHVRPYWNWPELYYTRCLVRNPYYVEGRERALAVGDCNLCEQQLDDGTDSGGGVAILENMTVSQATADFLQRHRPFIVTDAMGSWPAMEQGHFYFDNITELYMQPGSQPEVCSLQTNLRSNTPSDIGKLIRKLYSSRSWFAHWENCGKAEAKALRRFYRRPYFISPSMDFTGSNWVLISSEYSGRIYKRLEVSSGLSILYQFRGENVIRLIPREICRSQCPELVANLREGELLVMEHLLWVLEYMPGAGSDNLAILSEVEWEEEGND